MADPKQSSTDKLFADEHLRVFGRDIRCAFPIPDDATFEGLLRALQRLETYRDRT
jgi:hypothetical protein